MPEPWRREEARRWVKQAAKFQRSEALVRFLPLKKRTNVLGRQIEADVTFVAV
jgi:hypothetical protein